jgi:hypothetical protein
MTPARDIERTCQTCGKVTYCCIRRSVSVDKYGAQVEKAEAVCPACVEGTPRG